MQVYFHHVGSKGASDFDKTVFTDISIETVASSVSPDIRDGLVSDLNRLFPSGQLNCWGVPEGARSVIRTLAAGDCVLLVRGLNVEDSVPALCPVGLFWSLMLPGLSQALWGDVKYPYIFFFDTERLTYSWPQLVQDLSYKPNWNPAGTFNRVTPQRMASFGGVGGYISHLRTECGVALDPFLPVTANDIASEPILLFQAISQASVDEALKKLGEEAHSSGNSPSLTGPAGLTQQQRLERNAAFSVSVKRLYRYRCAVCSAGARGPGRQTEVDAAHIYPKRLHGSDDLRNGLCLCKRHHWAYDVGWFVIMDDLTVAVRPDIPPDPDYTFISQWQGQKISPSANGTLSPHKTFLAAQRALTPQVAAAPTAVNQAPAELASTGLVTVP